MLYDYKAQVVPLVIIINIKEAICTVSISRPLMIYQCEGGSGSTLTSATKLLTGKDDDDGDDDDGYDDDDDDAIMIMISNLSIPQVAVGLRSKDSEVWFHPQSLRKTPRHDQSVKPCYHYGLSDSNGQRQSNFATNLMTKK